MNNMDLRRFASLFKPRWWPVLFVHCLAGFAVMERAELLDMGWGAWLRAGMAGLIWTVLLAGPASALALVFCDGAEGESSGKERVGWVAIVMVLAGLPLGLLVSWDYWDAYRVGIILLALYAAPPIRLRIRPVAAALVEAAGLGALTFFAGLATLGRISPAADPAIPTYLFAFIFLYLAGRIASSDEQARSTPWIYWSAVGLGFAALAVAGVMMGNRWGAALLLIPLCVWCVAGLDRFDREYRERGGRWMTLTGAWLLTDVAVAFAAILR